MQTKVGVILILRAASQHASPSKKLDISAVKKQLDIQSPISQTVTD